MTAGRDTGGAQRTRQALSSYAPRSSFLLANESGTLVTHGVDAVVPKITSPRHAGLPGMVREFLANAARFGRGEPVVVGAVPFTDRLPAHLVLPGGIESLAPIAGAPNSVPRTPVRGRALPTDAEYGRNIRRIARRIDVERLDALPLARSWELTADAPLDAVGMLGGLAAEHAEAFAFGLPACGEDGPRGTFGPRPEPRRTLIGIGALRVSRYGSQVRCVANGQRLPVDILESCCAHGAIENDALFVGELRDPEISALDLALALHPSNTLASAEHRVITETEPFERGFSSGAAGWCDASGDGEWAIFGDGIEIEDNRIRLLASREITAASEPDAGQTETARWLHSRIRRLGLAWRT